MADIKYIRSLVGGIPTTLDLTASGNVLQAAMFQIVNAGVTASKPLKLDSSKKLTSGDINLESEVTGNLPAANIGSDIVNANIDAAAAIALSKLAALTFNRLLLSDGSGIVSVSSVTNTEAGHLSGVTSAIQTQLNAKAADADVIKKDGSVAFTGPQSMGSSKLTSLANGAGPNDAVNKSQLDSVAAGTDFQADVLDVQVDNTLDPGANPATGARYIIEDAGNLHANFGSIAGIGDDDIVQYDGDDFIVTFDASGHSGGGVLTWSIDDVTFYNYDGSSWSVFGGLAGVTAGDGLTKSGNTMNVGAGTGISVNSDDVAVDFGVSGSKAITATDLASVANAKGASLIGIEDSGTLTGQTDVEGYLAENRGLINTNTTHIGSDGSDHSIVGSNKNHVDGNGSDHADVASNTSHRGYSNNPHSVTKAQVSLTNVDDVKQLPNSYLDTDGTLAADSDTKVPSQKAVKTYVDVQVASVAQEQVDFPGVAGETLAANRTFIVRKAISGETAGRYYIATSDHHNAAGKHLAVGIVQTTAEISAADPITIIKFKEGVALKSGDTVVGASAADQGKEVYMNKAGVFSLDADAGITTGETYASRMVGVLSEYNVDPTSNKITFDVCVSAWFGFDLGA